jgi:4-amino-4-deoxy-L-arabinose transferase-like glycosyltransferase
MSFKGRFFDHPHRRALVTCLMIGLVMRIGIALALPGMAGDGPAYEQLAWNLAHNSSYSTRSEPPYQPSLMKSPGYPIFLAGVFLAVGRSHLAVRVVQAVLDTLTVLVVYLVARQVSAPAVLAGCIAALSPFIAIYARYLLSEVLATFMAALTLLAALRAMDRPRALRFFSTGVCLGILVLIRPDFALLPALAIAYFGIALYLKEQRLSAAVMLIALGSILPLAPWTVRNAVVFRSFQPLAAPGGLDGIQPTGFLAWVQTWHADLSERDRGVWPYWTREFNRFEFPETAFDSQDERIRVSQLLKRAAIAATDAEHQTIEDEFVTLARERARRNPIRMWLLLPAQRTVRLWVNSRTEAFPLPAFGSGLDLRSPAMLIKSSLTVLNLALLFLAILGVWAMRRTPVVVVMLAGLVAYRTLVHAYWAGMEARYVLEAFPAVYILAAEGIALIVIWAARTGLIPRPPIHDPFCSSR